MGIFQKVKDYLSGKVKEEEMRIEVKNINDYSMGEKHIKNVVNFDINITKDNIKDIFFFETNRDLSFKDGSFIEKGTSFVIDGLKDDIVELHFEAINKDSKNIYNRNDGNGDDYNFTVNQILEFSNPSKEGIQGYLKGLDYEEFKEVVSKEISDINLEDFKESGLNIEEGIKEHFELMKSDLEYASGYVDINELLDGIKFHHYTKEAEVEKGFDSLKEELSNSFNEIDINNMERYNVNIDKSVNDYIEYLKDHESTFKTIVEFFEPEKEKINERFSEEAFENFVDYEDRVYEQHEGESLESNLQKEDQVYVGKEYKSIYEYPDSEVLKNKLNIKNPDLLEEMERGVTTQKLLELNQNPIKGNFDLKHLQKIHNHIFNNIYEWSGKIRNEEIDKGGTNFAPTPYLLDGMRKQIFEPLKREKFLSGLNAEDLSKRLAYYYTKLNVAHPFKDGNGRTQREFIKELASKNGFSLDWGKADTKELFETTVKATIGADTKDGVDKLGKVILDCFDSKEPNKNLIKDMKKIFDIARDR